MGARTAPATPGEAVEVTGVPTELNRLLRAGDLDVANVSSIEYANAPERYVLLPSLCVGSEGAVDSVQLVSQAAAGRACARIAGDPESATSVALARAALSPRPRSAPRTTTADARLLIGDRALRLGADDPTPHYDLGALWRERTGLPMVFAVWAARARRRP